MGVYTVSLDTCLRFVFRQHTRGSYAEEMPLLTQVSTMTDANGYLYSTINVIYEKSKMFTIASLWELKFLLALWNFLVFYLTMLWIAKIIHPQHYTYKIWLPALVEGYWRGKTKLFGEKPVPVPLCPPQIPYELPCRGVKASCNGWISMKIVNIQKRYVTHTHILYYILQYVYKHVHPHTEIITFTFTFIK